MNDQIDITPFTAINWPGTLIDVIGRVHTGPTIFIQGPGVPTQWRLNSIFGHATPSTPTIPSEGILWPL